MTVEIRTEILYTPEEDDTERKTSQEWYAEIKEREGVEILDPDGWDRTNFMYSFHEERVAEDEFRKRLSLSTCKFEKIY